MNSLPTLSIIGGGRVGKTLGKLFVTKHLLSIDYVINRNIQSAKEAVTFIGEGSPSLNINEISSDFLLIAVSDTELLKVIHEISDSKVKPKIVFHTSGSYGDEVFEKLNNKGVLSAAVHPIKSFANVEDSIRTFSGTPCLFEGNKDAIDQLKVLLSAIEAICITSSVQNRPIYHAGLVMACQNIAAVTEAARVILEASGIQKQDSQLILARLIFETIHNTVNNGFHQALTGPVSRNDMITNELHLSELSKAHLEDEFQLYKNLSQYALKKFRS